MAIRVGTWAVDEDFAVHPVGSKPKRTLICPERPGDPLLIPGHRYLFKKAEGWRAFQVWSEVIAYEVGRLCDCPVPPCLIAEDERTGEIGALIEFFYGYPDDKEPARLVHAADLLQRFRSGPEAERPHNLRLNLMVCRALQVDSDPEEWWGRLLAFDALIGNTDRHTENWGVLARVKLTPGSKPDVRFKLAPFYDNGTSLGYELRDRRVRESWTDRQIADYLAAGRHHCGWDSDSDQPTSHFDLCRSLAVNSRTAGAAMRNVIRFDAGKLNEVLERLVELDAIMPLTRERATFISRLVEVRREHLLAVLGE